MKKLMLIPVILLSLSCTHSSYVALKTSGVEVALEDINSYPEAFEGEKVEMRVKVLGWKSCPESARITRNDVAVSDGTGCIYVKKGVNPKFWKKTVVIKGVIKVKDGKPYLDEGEVVKWEKEKTK